MAKALCNPEKNVFKDIIGLESLNLRRSLLLCVVVLETRQEAWGGGNKILTEWHGHVARECVRDSPLNITLGFHILANEVMDNLGVWPGHMPSCDGCQQGRIKERILQPAPWTQHHSPCKQKACRHYVTP
jgi:hypothetical protein